MRKKTGVRLAVLLVVLTASFLGGGLPGQAYEYCCPCDPAWCVSGCYNQCSDQACIDACSQQCWQVHYEDCINNCPWPIC